MSHSLHKIWIHAIWATKERLPLIQLNIENEVYNYLSKQFREIGCSVRIINGMPDHIHCLFLLSPQKSIADVIKQVKGSTAHWINENDMTTEKFSWQTGYAAYSVSESQLGKVYQYIKNQKSHHQKLSFENEYEGFMKLYQVNG
ncbi:MAG: IS200/IS605 family transposase [Sphingobacteriaceae bacterium]|nr:IS200/IS605 family transposase [Sphingobacteriaceae bacterium]